MMRTVFLLLVLATTAAAFGLQPRAVRYNRALAPSSLSGVSKKNRAWAAGDLGEDIFDDAEETAADKKNKFKLTPEIVFFEGPPAISEVILPALSIITVLGIVPFISSLSRQAWVRYKFTSRRVSIQSGIGGKVQTEIIYPDVEEIRFVYRAFGSAGDMVMFLKDGAKVELRHVPNFNEIYTFVLDKCDPECQAKSMKLTVKEAVKETA
jgi:Bacterial PH domain